VSGAAQLGYMNGRKDGAKDRDFEHAEDTAKPVMSPLKKGKMIVIDNILEPDKT